MKVGLRERVDLEQRDFCPRGWQWQNRDVLLRFSGGWELGMISTTGLRQPAQTAPLHSCLWTAEDSVDSVLIGRQLALRT